MHRSISPLFSQLGLAALLAVAAWHPVFAGPTGHMHPGAYGYAPQYYRAAYHPAYGYRAAYTRPAAAAARSRPVQAIMQPPVRTAAAPARAAQPKSMTQAAPPAAESLQARAGRDLARLADVPLDGAAAVPRIEVERLPAGFASIDDAELRKDTFLRILLPLVLLENEALIATRDKLLPMLVELDAGRSLATGQAQFLTSLARKYRVKGNPISSAEARAQLRNRVDEIPVSLALAQAANESAWGKSRFAREASNLFGIWTYDENKGIVPKRREAGKKHLVRKFDSLRESVRGYLHTLNSHPAYAKLRDIRAAQRRDRGKLRGTELAAGLEKYSALGGTYVRLIQDIIAKNDLEALNGARLNPARG